MLMGGPSVDVDVVVDLPSLAIFLGAATGALYPAVELDDDERDDDGRASIAYYRIIHNTQHPSRDATDFAEPFLLEDDSYSRRMLHSIQ